MATHDLFRAKEYVKSSWKCYVMAASDGTCAIVFVLLFASIVMGAKHHCYVKRQHDLAQSETRGQWSRVPAKNWIRLRITQYLRLQTEDGSATPGPWR